MRSESVYLFKIISKIKINNLINYNLSLIQQTSTYLTKCPAKMSEICTSQRRMNFNGMSVVKEQESVQKETTTSAS